MLPGADEPGYRPCLFPIVYGPTKQIILADLKIVPETNRVLTRALLAPESISCSLQQARGGGLRYPTSREKQARYGAPGDC
jgi:hypothetical protein